MAWSNIGGGGGENVSAEVARQKQLIEEMESLYKGKTTGADATADDILEGKKAYVGRKLITGTHPDVTAEVEEQTPLIQQIREAIVGKATLANATPDKIVKGYSAYVGQELVNGTLDPESLKGTASGQVTTSSKTKTLSFEHGLIGEVAFILTRNAPAGNVSDMVTSIIYPLTSRNEVKKIASVINESSIYTSDSYVSFTNENGVVTITLSNSYVYSFPASTTFDWYAIKI